MSTLNGLAVLFVLGLSATLYGADCQVALKYLSLEAAGNFAEANKFLALPAELNQFRDRPAFIIDKKPNSLADSEYQIVRALGALVRFELIGCNTGIFGTTATIRSVKADVLKLFPNRTEGVAIRTPKDSTERAQWLSLLRTSFGDLSKIPLVTESNLLPIVDSANGPRVGLPRF